jgi:hypothetical protein
MMRSIARTTRDPLVLTIPEPVWDTLVAAFEAAPPGHERVAYLDGIRFRDRDGNVHGVAATVTVPDAVTTPFNFRVSPQAMAQAGEHFAPLGLVRLAQVHTHGNACTRHSPTDDHRAYSQRDGALSLVLPCHASGRPRPEQAGVHIREPAGWRRVRPDEASRLIRLAPGIIDHRSNPWNASLTGTKATSVDGLSPSPKPGMWLSRLWPRRERHT